MLLPGGERTRNLIQEELSAHTRILRTTWETTLSQIPASTSREIIRECVYTFPFLDGISKLGFSCQFGDRAPRVITKEKRQARSHIRQSRSLFEGETMDKKAVRVIKGVYYLTYRATLWR